MSRVAREQMLCVVLPQWPHGEAPLRAADAALALAFERTGVVHFASLALLPPLPGAPAGSAPSLLLELAVDEGLRPRDTIDALVGAAVEPLWALLGARACIGSPPPSASGERALCLARLLLQHLNIADGAFVGARDRSVERIGQERDLMQAARAAVAAMPMPLAQQRPDTLAQALAGELLPRARFEWAREPIPRSFWRQPGAALRLVLAYAVLPLLLLWALELGLCWLAPRLPAPWSLASPLLLLVAAFSGHVVDAALSLLKAVLLPALGAVVLVMLAGLLFPPLRRVVRRIDRLLDHPAPSFKADAASVIVLLAVLALTAELVIRLVQWWAHSVLNPAGGLGVPGLWRLPWWGWLLMPALAVAALALLTLGRRRGVPAEVPRAHQVHVQIEACEQRLQGSVQHMISLTEIRRPRVWHRWWLRRWLRVVSWAGRVAQTEGWLGGAWGIHFGHWHIIDNGRRLLFCSNYDGNFGGYLDDFILGASSGLNAIWRRSELRRRRPALDGSPEVKECRRYPPTRLWFWRGARCEQWFKAYARDSMLPHVLRWAAYDESLNALNRASALRESLSGPRDMANNERVARSLES